MVKVAVLGSGLLGTKIAGELAYHGHRVKIYSSQLESLNTVFQRMEEDKQQLRQDGILLNRNFIGQVLCLSRLEETVCDADFVFECIPEDLEMKKDIFERVSHLCKPGTVIATNTLRLNVTEIAERTVNKERTLGLRFLYPVFYIPEVEITPNNYTSGQVIEKVRSLLEKMGKTLFFRSGSEPLILTEDQRDDRKKARQEEMTVNAGMGTNFGHGIPNLRQISVESGTSHGMQDNRVSVSDNDLDCAICMDKARDCVMRPCHHMVTCYMCAAMLINRRDGCPICRKDIIEIIRVYSG